MIIELYGLPGSGKSTFAKKLAERDNLAIIKIRSKKDLLFYNLIFLLKRPVKFLAGLYFVAVNSSGWRMFYYKFMNCFLQYNAKYEKSLKFSRAILDQGHFQNILSVFEAPISEKKMLFYLKFIPRPDELIIFNVSQDKIAERIAARGYLGRENLKNIDQQKWQETMRANHKLFLNNISKIKNLDYKIEASD